ncbi:MAG TPA: endonuclease Q family protein [Exilispira sp.]|nr:endonuclease Q family protein [Exilispira sp.]
MILTSDLHCHSGYSGGVGKISLDRLYENLEMKGINLYGSGDILQPEWRKIIKEALIESEEGLYILKNFYDKTNKFYPRIILETEIVLSAPYFYDTKKRKLVHLLMLFPSFKVVEEIAKIFENQKAKLNIGRPYLKFETLNKMHDFLLNLSEKYPYIEFIPAHIFTPDGVLGGENPIDSLEQFFGSFTNKINALESGLSADPDMILSIDKLNDFLVISNSDAHSEALNRIGREFFALEIDNLSYFDFISSIKKKRITYSVEFKPEHGRYYLTGHREDRHENKEQIYFQFENVPEDLICPVCKKKLIEGVQYRVHKLALKNIDKKKDRRKQKFFYSIPLIEIIALSLNSSIKSKKVEQFYKTILSKINFESNLYMIEEKTILNIIENLEIDDSIKSSLISIRKNLFKFDPPGFDGKYGELRILK